MNKQYQAILIVSTAATFYFFMFLVRVMMASIMDDLTLSFGLTESSVGFLSAAFVISYSLSQIPSGRFIDHHGARKSLLYSISGVLISTLLFQSASSFEVALLSRALLGFSCGCAFIAPLSLTHQWLDQRYFSTSAGLIQMLGCLGAVFSGRPMVALIDQIGWRDAVFLSAIVAAALFLLFFLIIKDNPSHNQAERSLPVFDALKEITSQKKYWLIGLIALASWAPIGGFTELWGVKYLMSLQNIDKSYATSQLILTWISIAIASPLFGYLSEYISMKKAVYISYSIGLFALAVLISGWITSPLIISVLLFLMGIASGGQPVAFGMINKVTPENLLATAVGFCNICVIAGAFIMQPLIGSILDNLATSTIHESLHFTLAFTPIIIVLIFGMIASYFVHIPDR